MLLILIQYLLNKFTQLSSRKFSCPNYAKILLKRLEFSSSSPIFYQQLKIVLNTAECLAPTIQRTCKRSSTKFSTLWFPSSSPICVFILIKCKQFIYPNHCWNALFFASSIDWASNVNLKIAKFDRFQRNIELQIFDDILIFIFIPSFIQKEIEILCDISLLIITRKL